MGSDKSYLCSSIPLLHLNGGLRKARVQVLMELLPHLTKRSIATLLVYGGDDAGVAPLMTVTSVFAEKRLGSAVAEHDNVYDFVELGRKFKGEYDLIIVNDGSSNNSAISLSAPVDRRQSPLCTVHPGEDLSPCFARIHSWLKQNIAQGPVWGCLLIGGQSRRMGRPKHLIKDSNGIPWVEKQAARLGAATEGVVLCGRGEVPDSLVNVRRLPDIAGAQGPLSGILAAMRWNPSVSWLVCACDMPAVDQAALHWLLEMRRPGVWATVPRCPRSNRLEPLLAHYDPRCRNLFETMLEEGNMRISEIGSFAKIETVTVPPDLATSWYNCNTPADLASLP